jgi:hypothetical protein
VSVSRRGEIGVIATKYGKTTYVWNISTIVIYGGVGRWVERKIARRRDAGTNSSLGVKRSLLSIGTRV